MTPDERKGRCGGVRVRGTAVGMTTIELAVPLVLSPDQVGRTT
jgi:hypothetical protein